ncbi:carbohydrate-binding protein [Thaumasiovibrio subtropicus]|uniref:carbohydrate-binding protein n=1 Tax=Thaumasiovibrio subtropicus TaxID=1891207 RepID=UPI00131A84D5|nr:carbohydrate-binding protein [Thaumasiovibrio subtropicus]
MNRHALSVAMAVTIAVNAQAETPTNTTPADAYYLGVANNVVEYFDKTGQLLKSTEIQDPDREIEVRDLVMSPQGLAYYNGTFNAELVVQTANGDFIQTLEGLSTANNLTYGGIAALGRYVYLTDTNTAYEGQPQGIVRFDIEGQLPPQRFLSDESYIDITVGNDGLLYALQDTYGHLDVLEPITLNKVKFLDLGHVISSRAVTADDQGNIYLASWDGHVYKFDSQGVELDKVNLDTVSLADIDINRHNEMLVTTRDGGLFALESNLNGHLVTYLSYGWRNFAAFAEPLSNFSPVLRTSGLPSMITQGETLSLDLTNSYDPEGQPLSYSVTSDLPGLTVHQAHDGVFEITAEAEGFYQVNVSVHDGFASDVDTYRIDVPAKNCRTDQTDPTADQYPQWQPDTVYTHQTVSFQGLVWKSKWWNINQAPSFSGPWTLVSDVSLPWDATRAYQSGETTVHNGKKYIANWWTRGEEPGSGSAWNYVGDVNGCNAQ